MGQPKANLLEAVMTTLNGLKLKCNLSGVTTDGVPSMCGNRHGLVKLLQNEADKVEIIRLFSFTVCHQESLCAKSLKM